MDLIYDFDVVPGQIGPGAQLCFRSKRTAWVMKRAPAEFRGFMAGLGFVETAHPRHLPEGCYSPEAESAHVRLVERLERALRADRLPGATGGFDLDAFLAVVVTAGPEQEVRARRAQEPLVRRDKRGIVIGNGVMVTPAILTEYSVYALGALAVFLVAFWA